MIRWFKRMWNKVREEIRYRKRLKERIKELKLKDPYDYK
jgi:hypothetical protein